jgi:hypothetical protein
MLEQLSDQVVQAHDQAGDSEGDGYEHKPCLEEYLTSNHASQPEPRQVLKSEYMNR